MKACFRAMLLLSLLLPLLPAEAQTPAADSLRGLLSARLRPDTVRVRWLLALGQELKTPDAPQATTVNQQALRLSRQLGDWRGEGQAQLALSNLYRRQNKLEAARRAALQAQRLYVRRGNAQGQGRAWLQLSAIYKVQDMPAAALAAALKGLPMAERSRDEQTRTRLRYIMGFVYHVMGNYTEALPLLEASLQAGQQTGDDQLVLAALGDMGNTYKNLKKWPQAMRYYQRALRLSQQAGDQQGEAGFETNLAEVYGLQGNQAAALAHGLRARQLVRTHHDEYTLPAVELMLGRAYLLSNQTDSVLALAHHALQLSEKTHTNGTIRDASKLLAEAYAQRRNFELAYRYRSLHMAYNDTLSGEDTQRKTSALRYGYELDKKQAQIALLTKTRELQAQKSARQRLQLYALLGGLGGLVTLAALLGRNIVLKQRANRHLNEKNQQIAAHRDTLNDTLTELKATQQQLVQSEKLVALAALTAGLAHEIQNPLNFVNNFSEVSLELVSELEEGRHQPARDQTQEAELLASLKQILEKIHQHGSRADRIIKGMLAHARGGGGPRQALDLNALVKEYLRLAYHDVQARHEGFAVACSLELAPHLGELYAVPQEVGRVLLNLYTNAFYALWQQALRLGPSYGPALHVSTCRRAGQMEVRVRDNGVGIAAAAAGKIFEPFYTTKPPGEGTGLGLSLSHDIITQSYGGTLSVSSREGEYTEFIIRLPDQSREQGRPLTKL